MTLRTPAFAGLFALSMLAAIPMAHPLHAEESAPRIAVVNMDQVLAQSKAGIALSEKLNAFRKEVEAESQVKQEEMQALREKISAGVGKGDQAQLTDLQKQFEAALLEHRQFQDEKNREAQKLRNDGLIEIQKQMGPIFKAIQEESDYDLILNQQAGMVLMASDRINITQTVIDRLE